MSTVLQQELAILNAAKESTRSSCSQPITLKFVPTPRILGNKYIFFPTSFNRQMPREKASKSSPLYLSIYSYASPDEFLAANIIPSNGPVPLCGGQGKLGIAQFMGKRRPTTLRCIPVAAVDV